MIESHDAVERAGEIAAVEGVDVILVGSLDLSIELEHESNPQLIDRPVLDDRIVVDTGQSKDLAVCPTCLADSLECRCS
jgi:2-keto-3-deoxy-L-rhamnonate aldolase RhmA